MTDSIQPRPFDERAYIAELERLADKIQATRRQREKAEAEFERFVKAFRHDRYTDLINQHEAALTGAPPPVAIGRSQAGGQRARPPSPIIPVSARAAAGSSGKKAVQRAATIAVAIGALLLAVWLWRSWPSSTPQQTTEPSAAPQSTSAPPAAPQVPPAPARALTIELVTLRPVWMRVTVDGRRVMERVFPQGQTIPVAADRTIAIRAGDGGSVRLSVGGTDQGVLGKDGFPANKTLTAPQTR